MVENSEKPTEEGFTDTIQVWIPSVEGVKKAQGPIKPLQPGEVANWIKRFVNLMSALFGGATTSGFRNPVFCNMVADALKMDPVDIYLGFSSIAGGYYALQDDPYRDLREAVLGNNGVFSDEQLLLLNDLPFIQSEPVAIVWSRSRKKDFGTENKEFVRCLLMKMGQETKQNAVAWEINGVFEEIRLGESARKNPNA